MPDSLKRALFEPFRQGEGAATSATPGTGIGLSLVQQFTLMHGGQAWVEDAASGGARFHVLLPHGNLQAHLPAVGSSA